MFDLRICSVLPGQLASFRNRWRDHAMPVCGRHGWHGIGRWVADKRDDDGHDQFVGLRTGESLAAIQKFRNEFQQDPGGPRGEKETEKDGRRRDKVGAFKMGSADFSLLK